MGYGQGRTALINQTFSGGTYHFSGNQDIDATLIGSKWTIPTLTYSFPTSGTYYGTNYLDGRNNSFDAFNSQQQQAVQYALRLVASYTNLTFSQTTESATNHAQLRFAQTRSGNVPSAEGQFPAAHDYAGDVWFGETSQPYYSTPAKGNWGFATQMHELGHALGLKHGHQDYTTLDLSGDIGPSAGGGPRYGSAALPSSHDGQDWSLMTYRSNPGATVDFQGDGSNQPQSYMQDDIAALQYLYGARYNAPGTTTVYRWSPTTGEEFINGVGQGAPTANKISMTVWDGGGNSTYDLSNYTTNLSVNLQPGAFSTFSTAQLVNHRAYSGGNAPAVGNVANALLYNNNTASLIKNVIGGSGNDTIIGNAADNVLTGGAGADVFTGNGGTDIYRDTASNLNGDRVTDFIYSDMVDVVDAGSAVSNLSYASGLLSFAVGSTAVSMNLGSLQGYVRQKADTTGGGGIDIYFLSQLYQSPVHANDLTYSSTASGYNHFIDLPNFESSFPDLVQAFGTDRNAMANWYNTYEPSERRVGTFDGLDYVASWSDLISAFKSAGGGRAVQDAGANHYITHGLTEGRATTFNGLDYEASYADLIKTFGLDNDAAAYHYIMNGSSEGRTTTFNGLNYVASYTDLIKAIGTNEQAGAAHYISQGINEGRSTTFDGLSYIANYADLMKALGANMDAGATHYIQNGASEGRATAFDVNAYYNAHPDLKGKYMTNDDFFADYISVYNKTGTYLT